MAVSFSLPPSLHTCHRPPKRRSSNALCLLSTHFTPNAFHPSFFCSLPCRLGRDSARRTSPLGSRLSDRFYLGGVDGSFALPGFAPAGAGGERGAARRDGPGAGTGDGLGGDFVASIRARVETPTTISALDSAGVKVFSEIGAGNCERIGFNGARDSVISADFLANARTFAGLGISIPMGGPCVSLSANWAFSTGNLDATRRLAFTLEF